MTDYTKSTNFTSKDSLSTGNPLKIIKGAEFDTEFNAISTAVATKADLNSPALIGIPTAPTASVGTNTTQIATTALVFAVMQALYPVGSIYTNISSSTNPATLFGFGTWVALEGVTVYGRSSTDATFATAGSTGGSKDAIVVSHTHTASQAAHTHTINAYSSSSDSFGNVSKYSSNSNPVANTTSSAQPTITVDSTGSSATNANLPPYVVAYMWKRTA